MLLAVLGTAVILAALLAKRVPAGFSSTSSANRFSTEPEVARFAAKGSGALRRDTVLTEFSDWGKRFQASALNERAAMVDQGVRLAQARRSELAGLIRTDPERALASTVSAATRRLLPAAVRELLEEPIAGVGEFLVAVKCRCRTGRWSRCRFPVRC